MLADSSAGKDVAKGSHDYVGPRSALAGVVNHSSRVCCWADDELTACPVPRSRTGRHNTHGISVSPCSTGRTGSDTAVEPRLT